MLAEIILSYAPDCTLIPLKVSCTDRKGIIMISASGNIGDSKGILYPAGYQKVICVGALDGQGNPASYSKIQGVDVFEDGTWKQAQGTSVACARVTGMFAQGEWQSRHDVQ